MAGVIKEPVDLEALTRDELRELVRERFHAAFRAIGTPDFDDRLDLYKSACAEQSLRWNIDRAVGRLLQEGQA